MSADRQALLDNLRDDPGNVRLRMIYADWLEDAGQAERAEYVRLCYELSGLDEDDPHAVLLEQRRKELFGKHGQTWAAGLSKEAATRLSAHGLVQRLETTAAAFLKCADKLRDEPLACLKLTNPTRQVKKLARCAALADVRELILFGGYLDQPSCKALAESPHLGKLNTLRLVSCNVQQDQAAILATAPWLANLRTLDLGHYERRDDQPSNSLWRNVGLSWAISLGLTNHLADAGFRCFLESPHLKNLQSLIVTNNWVTPQSARLLWEGRFPRLRHLDLSYNYLGPDGLRELVASDLLRQLTSLEIQCNEVGDDAVAVLASSRNARNLTTLDVSGALQIADRPKLTRAAAEALASSPNLAKLTHLVLAYCSINSLGAQALARTTSLPALRTLWLPNNPIRDRGARAFASSPLLGQLETLDLSACGVTAGAALAFARSQTAGEHLQLDLGLNALGSVAAEALVGRYGDRVTLVEPSDEMPF